MRKAIITQEQADAIEHRLKKFDRDFTMNLHKQYEDSWILDSEPLNGLTNSELAKALYIGYEVEPEFKVGDWVVVDGYSEDYDGKVLNITKIYKGALNLRYCKFSPSNDNSHNFCLDSLTKVRHATPEEIAQEKERRWWASHGRDVWELKYNDIIYDCIEEDYINAGYLSVGEHEQERFDVVCFADDRKDVKE